MRQSYWTKCFTPQVNAHHTRIDNIRNAVLLHPRPHPLFYGLREPDGRFMREWDNLTPAERRAIEIDAENRMFAIEEAKLTCPVLYSPTPPTLPFVEQRFEKWVNGLTSGRGASQGRTTGKSNSHSKR